MKSVMVAGLLAALAIAPIASAEAAVIYTFAGTSQPGSTAPVPLNVEVVLTSAESSFNLSSSANSGPAPTFSGDLNRFISLTVGLDRVTPDFQRGGFGIQLGFDITGAVTRSRLVFDGSSTDALLSGTGSTASGTVGQAATSCRNNEANCRVSGTWTVTTPTPVPEPMSITLFGAGLVGLAMVRRRKA